MDLNKYCDNRVMSGYKSALLYYDPSDPNERDTDGSYRYHLLIALETVPTVSGSVDTFEFDLTTCPTKGQVEGKETLDQKDADFMWHRDNILRLEALQGKILNFLIVWQDFTARGFVGTIKVRPQDASGDIMRGTFTITPMSADITSLPDARELIKDTVVFNSTIPASVKIKDTYKLEIKTDPEDATLVAKSENSDYTASIEGKTLSITYSGEGTKKSYGVVYITASKTDTASWTTSIAVENEINKD